ncbi:unnamed protein product [Camellia sinensis]
MSWLARSIANSLRLDDDQIDNNNDDKSINAKDDQSHQSDPSSPSASERGGVKEDISELTKTLTRQLWGVASFLAPPPQSPPSQISDSTPQSATDLEASDAAGIDGIRSDFAEIGGRFRSGISKLSSNKAVSEFTKIASNFLQLGSEQGDYGSAQGAVGVTDEVVAFARDIAMHPETWLDFPLPDDNDDDDDEIEFDGYIYQTEKMMGTFSNGRNNKLRDHQNVRRRSRMCLLKEERKQSNYWQVANSLFDMSDAQQEHALAVERLAPRLAALRIELCPGYMSEDCFWKIYFVLLHPRLSKNDAELLSTPQIVKARALLTQELQNRTKAKPEQDWSGRDASYSNDIASVSHERSNSVPTDAQSEPVPLETSAIKQTTSTEDADIETEKHQVHSTEIPIIDKSVIEEGPVNSAKEQTLHSDASSRVLVEQYEDDGDDWLKDESSEIVGAGGTTIPVENEEDVSFSDLEEDDGDVPTSYKKMTYGSDSSTKESRDWVQLSRSSSDSTKDVNAVSVERAGSQQVSAHNPRMKESNDWLDVDEIDIE